MRQLLAKNKKIIVEEVPLPNCLDNGVIVENRFSLISTGTELRSLGATDLDVVKKATDTKLLKNLPLMIRSYGVKGFVEKIQSKLEHTTELGYSSAGVVVRVGKNVRDISVGDKVACAGAGYANHSEFVFVPRNLVAKIPERVSFEEACFSTVASIAMHGMRRGKIGLGEKVAVIGCGLIGVLTLELLKANGAMGIGIESDRERIALLKSMGLNVVHVSEAEETVHDFSQGIGVDSAIITAASDSNEPMELASRLCRVNGQIIVVGVVGLTLDRSSAYRKEIDVKLSRSYGPGRYDPLYEEFGVDYPFGYVRWTENRNMQSFLELAKEKKVDVRKLVGGIYELGDAEKGYDELNARRILAALIKYSGKKDSTSTVVLPEAKAKKTGQINVGIISDKRFEENAHLNFWIPNMAKIPDFSIKGISLHKGNDSKEMAQRFNAGFCTTDFNEIINNADIDLVFVSATSEPEVHSMIAKKALEKGKHVFLDKPIALSEKKLAEFKEAVKESRSIVMVGHNRRFSPLTKEVKDIFSKSTGPMIINYRVVVAQKEINSLAPEEAYSGEIINEMTHFFDFFMALSNGIPEKIEAFSCGNMGGKNKTDSNIVVTIKFSDGSIGNLVFTSMGSKKFGKENIELFKGGYTVKIEDFKKLIVFGERSYSKEFQNPEKGWLEELMELKNALRSGKTPEKDLADSIKSNEIAFEVYKKINGGMA
ncbi:MAG: bi-domain-containing oxidoreductase [Candidatus Diapherotrites archaeon]|nr:bi-domain-containing oxidoreductase [Candidatus Diapherotrites archaeon]